jgi:hypothetical protein
VVTTSHDLLHIHHLQSVCDAHVGDASIQDAAQRARSRAYVHAARRALLEISMLLPSTAGTYLGTYLHMTPFWVPEI